MAQIRRPTELRPARVRPEVVEAQIARLDECGQRLRGRRHAPQAVAELLAAWLREQAAGRERAGLVDHYELQLRAAVDPASLRVLERWERASERLGAELLRAVGAESPEQDARLVMGAIEGLRFYELGRDEFDHEQVRRQLERLLAALAAEL